MSEAIFLFTNALLTRLANSSLLNSSNSLANGFLIDQTREEYSSLSGNNAIGPVDKNLCQAVSFLAFFITCK